MPQVKDSGVTQQASAIDVRFAPDRQHPRLPVEIVDRRELLARMSDHHLVNPQRARFHQLILCTEGRGVHHVDFVPLALSKGSLLHIRPGQVQKFASLPAFDAHMIIWPDEQDPAIPFQPNWYPGSQVPTALELGPAAMSRVTNWIAELGYEQQRFDGSPRGEALMRSILSVILLLVDELGAARSESVDMPQPYLDLREVLERRLYERCSVSEMAGEVGYSSRTLDRACQAVSGQTAKQVVDERVTLELRRVLADRTRSIATIRNEFGFIDSSNFAKFVRRHLGQSPGGFRQGLR